MKKLTIPTIVMTLLMLVFLIAAAPFDPSRIKDLQGGIFALAVYSLLLVSLLLQLILPCIGIIAIYEIFRKRANK